MFKILWRLKAPGLVLCNHLLIRLFFTGLVLSVRNIQKTCVNNVGYNSCQFSSWA